MINIEKFFQNHFDTKAISDNRLKAFCIDHINKLTAWLSIHADAELSAVLAELQSRFDTYFGAINDEGYKLAVQQGDTIDTDNAWTAALDFIRQQEGTIKGIWGKDSSQYQAFYPHGLDEYNQASKLDKDSLLVRYLAAANNYSPDLPPNFEGDFTALKNEWETKFTEQQTQIGLVKDATSQKAITRDPLEVELSISMLIIASKNVGHPEMVNDFFNQSLIRRNTSIPAHTIILRGKITYGLGTPVEGAVISVQGENPPGYTTQTDAEGRYEFTFSDVNPGENHGTLTVIAQGFAEHSQAVNPKFGAVTVVNVTMTQAMQIAA